MLGCFQFGFGFLCQLHGFSSNLRGSFLSCGLCGSFQGSIGFGSSLGLIFLCLEPFSFRDHLPVLTVCLVPLAHIPAQLPDQIDRQKNGNDQKAGFCNEMIPLKQRQSLLLTLIFRAQQVAAGLARAVDTDSAAVETAASAPVRNFCMMIPPKGKKVS